MKSHRALVSRVLTVVASSLASALSAQTLTIDHQGVACAAAEKFPRLTARFSPIEPLAGARVVFQGQNKEEWYSVAMKADGAAFSAVLPKPKKSLKSFRYYIEATGKSLEVSRTAEFSTLVVDSAGACRGGVMSATVGSASVLLQGPAGIATIPAGFASTGVVAGTAAGSGGAAGAAGSSAGGVGGGLGATAAVIGGVAVAGAAGVVVASKGDSEGAGSTTYTGTMSGQYVHTQDVVSPVGTPPRTCLHNWTFSGTVTVRLRASGGVVSGELETAGTQSQTGVSGDSTCSSSGPGGNLFFRCNLSGTSTNFSCGDQSTTTSGIRTSTQTHSFTGSLTGGGITGAIAYSVTGQSAGVNSGGNFTTTDRASVSVPVTLQVTRTGTI